VNHIYYVLLPLALTALVVTGCSSGPRTPASPSPIVGSTALTADVLAATWRLHSIQPAGQAEQVSPAGADYTLTFTDRLSLRADCNTCSSSFTIDGSTISVASAMACTRAFCPTAAFAHDYTSLMSGDFTVTTTASSMTWSSPRGTIRFSR
jgi:heat shock protein HslJ